MENRDFSPPGRDRRGALSIPDDAAIQRWRAVPPFERLRWLAEANRFLYLARPPEVRARWHAFRREEL